MVFLKYWNTLLHGTCWGIRSVQVVQPQRELQVELWVAGARGKRPGSGADPLHNKGHKSLWPCRETAGTQHSAGRPQTMACIRLGGFKSPGNPWGSFLGGSSLGCYFVGCTMKKLLKGTRGLRLLWETWVEPARKSCLTVGEWRVEGVKPTVRGLRSQPPNRVAPGLSDRKGSLTNGNISSISSF